MGGMADGKGLRLGINLPGGGGGGGMKGTVGSGGGWVWVWVWVCVGGGGSAWVAGAAGEDPAYALTSLSWLTETCSRKSI